MLIALVLGCFIGNKAQKVVLRSNLLYDATTTMSLGLEFRLTHKRTLDVPMNYNPWKLDNGRRLRHRGIQLEVRYWFCGGFGRTFIGAHGYYVGFNVGGPPDWPFISENMRNNRYQGHLYDGGVSVGHSWILEKYWSVETSIGVRYAHVVYDKYPCKMCGTELEDSSKNYFGPTKVSVSLTYVIK